MRIWEWLAARYKRPVVTPPITPAKEHEAFGQRLNKLQRDSERVTRLAKEYRDMDEAWR